jgi:hypothetical protein
MYYKHLKIDIPPVLDMSVLTQLPDKGHVPVPMEYINKELTDFMGHRGIYIKNADVFCSPPGFELGIHVDGIVLSNNVATNWEYCDEFGAVMQWWKPKSTENKIVDPSKENAAYGVSTTPYALAWHKDEVDFLDECDIRKPTLVNIGVPHSMINRTHSYRKALSITWRYKGRDLEWDDAIELFKDVL